MISTVGEFKWFLINPANRCSKVWIPFSLSIFSFGLQNLKSKTVILSPFGVCITFATLTAGAGIIVWSTLKLSNSGIFIPHIFYI